MRTEARKTIRLPFLLVGFKTYLQGTGENALKLSRMAKRASAGTGVSIVPIAQFTDIALISREVGIPVFAQHIDPIQPGSYTGYVLPEAVRGAGAAGTLINHPERKLQLGQIEAAVGRAKEVGLLSCVCSEGPELSAAVSAFGPDIILIEDSDLIGKGRAISSANPQTVRATLEAVKAVNPGIRVMCGAGISSAEDVAAALRLGMDGVGATSAIIKSPDPHRVMVELAQALGSNWRGKRPVLHPPRRRSTP